MASGLVGVNYDDGIYALLARALARGDGYRLTFIPGGPPGVKYPPLYPLTLVPFWTLASGQDAALWGMKLANGIYVGVAAGLFTLLLANLRLMPVNAAAVVALLSFASGSMMLITAGVLSEPLYLLLLFAGLWVADSTRRDASRTRLVLAGLLVALVALTRMVGVALLAAVLFGAWRRLGRGRTTVVAAAALLVLVPWLLYTLAFADQIPEVLVPRYGSYAQLYLSNLAGRPLAALEIGVTNLGAVLETLGGKLVPQVGAAPRSLVGALLLGFALLGSVATYRSAPATALYPWLYLGIVSLWSFPPFRFVFVLFPLLLALATLGFVRVVRRVGAGHGERGVRSGWRSPRTVGLALGAALLTNLAYREGRALTRRVWDGAELDRSAASAEVIAWVQRSTDEDDIVAYEFDPLIALHTARRAVPNNYEPVHLWYGRSQPAAEPLALLLRDMGVDYLAVRANVPLAAAPVDALIERYPESLSLEHVTERGAFIFATNLGRRPGEPQGSGDAAPVQRGAAAEVSRR